VPLGSCGRWRPDWRSDAAGNVPIDSGDRIGGMGFSPGADLGRPRQPGGLRHLIASGKAGFDSNAGFQARGFGEHAPGGCSRLAALIRAVVLRPRLALTPSRIGGWRAGAGLALDQTSASRPGLCRTGQFCRSVDIGANRELVNRELVNAIQRLRSSEPDPAHAILYCRSGHGALRGSAAGCGSGPPPGSMWRAWYA
jgi:hypothetical protein